MRPDEKVRYLDRRLTGTSSGVSAAYAGGFTTWTLPYSVALDGSEGTLVAVRTDTNAVLTTTRPAENQIRTAGDLRAIPVYLGVTYQQLFQPTRLYPRSQEGRPESRGTLTLRYLDVEVTAATDLTVTVTLPGRSPRTTTLNHPEPVSRPLRVPIHGRNRDAEIVLSNSTPGGCSLVALDWEGTFTIRSRRI